MRKRSVREVSAYIAACLGILCLMVFDKNGDPCWVTVLGIVFLLTACNLFHHCGSDDSDDGNNEPL